MSSNRCREEETENDKSEFRAPPPSPIATAQGRKSAGVNTEILSDFLERSIPLRIPELILPEPCFCSIPYHIPIPHHNLPAFDLQSLRSSRATRTELLQSAMEFGCFQVLNHGISPQLMERVDEQCNRLFNLPDDKKQMICRSEERPVGFEKRKRKHLHEHDEETFWVGKNEDELEKAMIKVWPEGFRNFSWAMSEYSGVTESIASEMMEMLYESLSLNPSDLKELLGRQNSSVLCLISHGGAYKKTPCGRAHDSHALPHLLSVHYQIGSCGFYVYAEHGWTSVNLKPNSLVITVGNILKAWSNGVLKSVKGRPIRWGESNSDRNLVSMEYVYSPPSTICTSTSVGRLVKVSLADQFLVVIILILLWRLISYVGE